MLRHRLLQYPLRERAGARGRNRRGRRRFRDSEERVVLLDPQVLRVVLGDVAGDPVGGWGSIYFILGLA